jgi:hypothetical protein
VKEIKEKKKKTRKKEIKRKKWNGVNKKKKESRALV